MRTMHLFAGAGGGLLVDLLLGHEPVCAVEWLMGWPIEARAALRDNPIEVGKPMYAIIEWRETHAAAIKAAREEW